MKRSFEDQIKIYRRRSILLAMLAPFVAFAVFTGVGIWLFRTEFWALSAIGLVIILATGSHGYFYAAPAMHVSPTLAEPDEAQRQLLKNLRDELSIGTGVHSLRVVMVKNTAIDAFALGNQFGLPTIGITEGALQACNREELLSMLAFAAASQRMQDIRFLTMVWGLAMLGPNMLRLIGDAWASAISDAESLVIAVVGAIIALILCLFAWVGAMWLYRLILSKRQKLADALALQVSRHPEAYMSAMEKAASKPLYGMGGDVAPIAFVGCERPKDARRAVIRRINTIGRVYGVQKKVLWGG